MSCIVELQSIHKHTQTNLGKAVTIIVRVRAKNAAFAIRDYTYPLRVYTSGIGCIVNA